MNALILTAVLFTQAPDAPPTATNRAAPVKAEKSLDGNWTVVCYEKDGKPMPEAKDCQVMVKDNVATFTCKDDKNKITALRLECGDKGTIKATEVANAGSDRKPGDHAKAMTGVCVKTAEYVAICVHPADANTKTGSETTNDRNAESKPACTVILKRAGGSEPK